MELSHFKSLGYTFIPFKPQRWTSQTYFDFKLVTITSLNMFLYKENRGSVYSLRLHDFPEKQVVGVSSKYINKKENISKPSYLLVTNFRRDFLKLQGLIYKAYHVCGHVVGERLFSLRK